MRQRERDKILSGGNMEAARTSVLRCVLQISIHSKEG